LKTLELLKKHLRSDICQCELYHLLFQVFIFPFNLNLIKETNMISVQILNKFLILRYYSKKLAIN